jgi:TolB-like protein/Tfp pilus assembly protein PilF/class 3 adenylate cyclase
MATEVKTEFELEIAHVLFIDTVGYSKLLISEQRELLDKLNHVVRNSDRFRAAESAGKLIRLPTGDGMALVFLDSPEAPAQCASEISRALKGSLRLPLRMGIHSGPVSRVVDVNDRSNAAGAGINIAQRVMSCGDAGHILLSKRAADDLVEYPHWQPHLHEVGECEVKHGKKIALVNLYSDEIGNPELPTRCKERDRKFLGGGPGNFGFSGRRKIALITTAILGMIALAFVTYAVFLEHLTPSSKLDNASITPPIPNKIIAVLPFENLSDDKQNAYFADGVQDEILTVLAKVADLKVISRTSVMQYKVDVQRNLREIAKTLGVAHVLEGSVQRAGGHVRVSAQLIDARTDTHLWAEHYDRELADVFGIESEVAEQIVSQLKARLSPREKAAIQERPTSNVAAYDLYIQAKALMAKAVYVRAQENLFDAATLLNDAVARDPAFFLGYCRLASVHDQIYLVGIDHTPARLALADAAVKTALRLRPDSGEAHLAVVEHLYCGYLDYDRARDELAIARAALPNEPRVFELAGYIDRRQGHWDDATRNLQRALELDPRNFYILQQIARSYDYLRRYPDEVAILNRALTIMPQDAGVRLQRVVIDLERRADTKPLHLFIETILRENPQAAEGLVDQWLYLALCERDHDSASRALSVMPENGYTNEGFAFPKSWCEAVVARARGDALAERTALTAARAQVEKTVREQPEYAQALCVLGMIDAGLGRKADAIREGRRAIELLPVTKESINGSLVMEYLAVIYTWVGENDLAFDQLEATARIPSPLTYGDLALHPFWDSLRGDPRFEKIVASLAPSSPKP